jgi:hypothetical protein
MAGRCGSYSQLSERVQLGTEGVGEPVVEDARAPRQRQAEDISKFRDMRVTIRAPAAGKPRRPSCVSP